MSYSPGDLGGSPYFDAAAALGSPTRFTGERVFPGAVTPFNPAFGVDEIVSIGVGGELVVSFARPVRDDARNPFGIDLLVFGNTGYEDTSWPHGIAGGLFGGGDGGVIEVSRDGVAWVLVPGVQADGAFPTLGYLDLTDPYATGRGSDRSSFTRPVDPAFDAAGLPFAEIVAGYAGSGGGAGIDLAALGLDQITHVRFSTAAGSVLVPEIDAVADVRPVPSTGGVAVIVIAAVGAARRRRRAPGCVA